MHHFKGAFFNTATFFNISFFRSGWWSDVTFSQPLNEKFYLVVISMDKYLLVAMVSE